LFRDSTVDNLLKYSSNDLGYSVINWILNPLVPELFHDLPSK